MLSRLLLQESGLKTKCMAREHTPMPMVICTQVLLNRDSSLDRGPTSSRSACTFVHCVHDMSVHDAIRQCHQCKCCVGCHLKSMVSCHAHKEDIFVLEQNAYLIWCWQVMYAGSHAFPSCSQNFGKCCDNDLARCIYNWLLRSCVAVTCQAANVIHLGCKLSCLQFWAQAFFLACSPQSLSTLAPGTRESLSAAHGLCKTAHNIRDSLVTRSGVTPFATYATWTRVP